MKGINFKAIVFVAFVVLFVALAVLFVRQLVMVQDHNAFVKAERIAITNCILSSNRAPVETFEVSIGVCIGMTEDLEALSLVAVEVDGTYKLGKDAKDRLAVKLQRQVFKLDTVLNRPTPR
jgi:hypothetical protein